MPIRVVIADDHEIFRDGFKAMLNRQNDVTVVGEASNGKELIDVVSKLKPQVVITDIKMPQMNGIDATRILKSKHANISVIALTMIDEENIVVDMRNHYESEIGYFKNAIRPKVDTFREEIEYVSEMLADQKDRKILLYCTGGIRCEKASAYLKHQGFKDVNQLHGGIIEYAQKIKELNLPSNFMGKNFVFDERMGESVTGQVIAQCHQCGNPCDTHVNCANNLCHVLFIQCPECADKHENCCSEECRSVKNSPLEFQNNYLKHTRKDFGNRHVYRKSFRLVNDMPPSSLNLTSK